MITRVRHALACRSQRRKLVENNTDKLKHVGHGIDKLSMRDKSDS